MTIVGHDTQFLAMRAALDAGRMHHAWLLHGPQGVGKASFARAIAARILAEASANPPGDDELLLDPEHPTARLIAARSHPDYHVLEREVWHKSNERLIAYADRDGSELPARNIRILQVRWLQAQLAMAPSISTRRVVVIDTIDDMEKGAANALLKSLEEPPASTIFLLVSHAPGRLLPTLRSRCRSLAFTRLANADMARVVAELAPDLDDMTRAVVTAIANGAPGVARDVIAADVPGIDAALREIATTGDPHNVMRLELAGNLTNKAGLPRYLAFLQRAPAFIAVQARGRAGAPRADAIAAWESARALADTAVAQSLPVEDVVFAVASAVASLAPRPLA